VDYNFEVIKKETITCVGLPMILVIYLYNVFHMLATKIIQKISCHMPTTKII